MKINKFRLRKVYSMHDWNGDWFLIPVKLDPLTFFYIDNRPSGLYYGLTDGQKLFPKDSVYLSSTTDATPKRIKTLFGIIFGAKHIEREDSK
jgi:hypothetical protein